MQFYSRTSTTDLVLFFVPEVFFGTGTLLHANNPVEEEEMIAPNEIMHSDVSMSEFKYEIMTSIFWDFQKELWYDPSAKQEVMTKLWLHDSEREYYEGWKNYPPVGEFTDTNRHQFGIPSCTADRVYSKI